MKNIINRSYRMLFPLILSLGIVDTWAQSKPKELLITIYKNESVPATSGKEEINLYKSHQNNLQQLLDDGYLNLIGFLKPGGAIFMGKAKDQPYIQERLDQDGAIEAGIYLYKIKAFEKKTGSICRFRQGCHQVNYQLITFWPNLNKETVKIAALMEYKHQSFLEASSSANEVVLIGAFDGLQGNFLIYQGEDFKDFISSDPAVVNDYLLPENLPFTSCDLSDCSSP
ncbi:hypothetical protein QQ020_16120 [Fulvivirgaceae bacterium BMA12]|uniref:Uncharacterized protein n=1 Tax=Agaribacillus aureus TaxID=3051825 RepID=A0ABT8L765_9BACT|nr:hypothetical protein [Fulvivirgaceae bacterium BMA12]